MPNEVLRLAEAFEKVAGELRVSFGELREAVNSVTDALARDATMRRLFATALVLDVVITVVMFLQLFITQHNRVVLNTVRNTNATISDCVNPSGTCAKRAAAQTGQVLQILQQQNAALVVCALDPEVPKTKAALVACATRLVAGG